MGIPPCERTKVSVSGPLASVLFSLMYLVKFKRSAGACANSGILYLLHLRPLMLDSGHVRPCIFGQPCGPDLPWREALHEHICHRRHRCLHPGRVAKVVKLCWDA